MFDNNNMEPNMPPIVLAIVLVFALGFVASLTPHPGWVFFGGIVVFACASFAKNNM